jgi:hypothetical protein
MDRSKPVSAGSQGEEPVHTAGLSAGRSGRSAHSTEDVHRERDLALWELMLSKENLLAALNRVEANRGAPGVDGYDHGRAPAVAVGLLARCAGQYSTRVLTGRRRSVR